MTDGQKMFWGVVSIVGNFIAIVGLLLGVFFALREEFASAYTAMVFAHFGKNSIKTE